MFQQLKWLYGAGITSFIIALISDQIIKVAANEATTASHNIRGGVFGAVMGIGTGILGMPSARNKVQTLRERVFSTSKDK